jgi:uncharacterized membrane protein YadS
LFSNIINKKQDTTAKYSIKLPMYLLLFIAVSLVVTFFTLPKEYLALPKTLSSIGLTIAMVAIGMGISFRTLIQSGGKALLFGSLIFAAYLIIILALIQVLF